MSAKQFSQSLTHKNCEIPYVIGNEWENLSKSSMLGVHYAEFDGEVIYNNNDLLITHYPENNKIDINRVNPIQKTSSIFASTLRDSIKSGKKFKKDDIIYEYDCFRNGIPSSGYNCNTAYMPFFGLIESKKNKINFI